MPTKALKHWMLFWGCATRMRIDCSLALRSNGLDVTTLWPFWRNMRRWQCIGSTRTGAFLASRPNVTLVLIGMMNCIKLCGKAESGLGTQLHFQLLWWKILWGCAVACPELYMQVEFRSAPLESTWCKLGVCGIKALWGAEKKGGWVRRWEVIMNKRMLAQNALKWYIKIWFITKVPMRRIPKNLVINKCWSEQLLFDRGKWQRISDTLDGRGTHIFLVHRRSFQATAGSTTSKYTVGVTTNDVPELQQIHRVASSYSAIVCIPRLDANCPLQLDLRQAHTRTCWFVLQLVKQVPPFVNLALNILFKHQKGCNLSFVSHESWPSCFQLLIVGWRVGRIMCHTVSMQFVTKTTKAKANNNFTLAFVPQKTTNDSQDKSACATSPRKKEKKLTWRFNTQPTWRKLSNTIQISPTSVKSIDFPSRPHADARRPLRKSTCNS